MSIAFATANLTLAAVAVTGLGLITRRGLQEVRARARLQARPVPAATPREPRGGRDRHPA